MADRATGGGNRDEITADPAGDNTKLAVSAIVIAVFALSLGDASIKQISTSFTLWQIFVVRSVLAVPVLIAVIKFRYPSVSLLPDNVGWTAVRSAMLAFMWLAYYIALPHLALSIAASVYYVLPLFITLFAALFIGDRIGRIGWFSVFLGFSGVLVILRPQVGDFNLYALLPLASAILYALAMILTRTKCRTEHPLILALSLNLCFVLVGLLATAMVGFLSPSESMTELYPFLLGEWSIMGRDEFVALGLLATAIIIGSVASAIAYQSGPSSTVATFDFSYLVFAATWGFLFFGEVPDALTLIGMAMIFTAGVLAVRR